MPTTVTLADLSNSSDMPLLVDVRKAPARAASGRTIPGSRRGAPDCVAEWGPALEGRRVVVFCVHGHEVSRNVADRLTEFGVEAACLEGGFEAWEAGGNPVAAIGADE